MSEKEKFRDLVLRKEKEGKVILMGFEGPMEANLEDIIKQPTEGLLYDLNRDRVTVLTFIEDIKWVNDFAVGLVIAKLKEKIITRRFKRLKSAADQPVIF